MVIIQSSLETLKWIIITSDLHAKMTCVVHVIQEFRKKLSPADWKINSWNITNDFTLYFKKSHWYEMNQKMCFYNIALSAQLPCVAVFTKMKGGISFLRKISAFD